MAFDRKPTTPTTFAKAANSNNDLSKSNSRTSLTPRLKSARILQESKSYHNINQRSKPKSKKGFEPRKSQEGNINQHIQNNHQSDFTSKQRQPLATKDLNLSFQIMSSHSHSKYWRKDSSTTVNKGGQNNTNPAILNSSGTAVKHGNPSYHHGKSKSNTYHPNQQQQQHHYHHKSKRYNTFNADGTALPRPHHNNSHHPHRHHMNNRFNKYNHSSSNTYDSLSSPYLKDKVIDSILTFDLTDTLTSHGVFENKDGARKRLMALNHLEQLIMEWAESLRIERQRQHSSSPEPVTSSSDEKNTMKVQLISFGSYRLGVHRPNADLDLLALCPPHVTRKDFFSTLVERLTKDSEVNGLHPIPGAYTPVIKFYLSGIPVDLLFVSLVDGSKLIGKDGTLKTEEENASSSSSEPNSQVLPSTSINFPQRIEFELDDSMLVGLDEPSVRSLNGVRVAQFLLQLVPNKENFCLVLRTVKQWAIVNGLYSNVLGFLGGINWAILVCWVCMRNENASSPKLLRIFFNTFSKWRWPKPVKLVPVLHTPPTGVMPLPIWNPKVNPRDGVHIMPIITPMYPCMNSSYNVGQPQIRRFQEEMFRASQTLNKITGSTVNWEVLLRGNNFFKQHIHYVQVTIKAEKEEEFRSWFGFCESRLRILIAGLDSQELGIKAYPFAKFFDWKDTKRDISKTHEENEENTVMATSFFIALRFAYGVETVDIKACTEEFCYKVNNWENRTASMDLQIEHKTQNDLPSYVFHNDPQSKQSAKKTANFEVEVDVKVNVKKVNDDEGFPHLCAESRRRPLERKEDTTAWKSQPNIRDASSNPSPMKKSRTSS